MREASCPQCRGAARLVSNPYYGAGLAVHRDLLVCQECGYSGFAENDREPVEHEDTVAADGALRRLLRILRGDGR
jgi:C4-type Zn-finger protein